VKWLNSIKPSYTQTRLKQITLKMKINEGINLIRVKIVVIINSSMET